MLNQLRRTLTTGNACFLELSELVVLSVQEAGQNEHFGQFSALSSHGYRLYQEAVRLKTIYIDLHTQIQLCWLQDWNAHVKIAFALDSS